MYHSVPFWIAGNKMLGEMSIIHEIANDERLHLINSIYNFIYSFSIQYILSVDT